MGKYFKNSQGIKIVPLFLLLKVNIFTSWWYNNIAEFRTNWHFYDIELNFYFIGSYEQQLYKL